MLSLANVFPDECAKLYTLYVEGKKDEAAAVSEKIVGLNKVVSGMSGVASVKAAMDLAGFHGGEPRRPISGITAGQRKELKDELVKRGFLS